MFRIRLELKLKQPSARAVPQEVESQATGGPLVKPDRYQWNLHGRVPQAIAQLAVRKMNVVGGVELGAVVPTDIGSQLPGTPDPPRLLPPMVADRLSQMSTVPERAHAIDHESASE